MLLIAAAAAVVVGPSMPLVQRHYGNSLRPLQSWHTVSRKMGFGSADSYRNVQAVAAVAAVDSIVVGYSCPGSCKACVVVEVWHTRAASVVRHFALQQHIVGSVGILADQVVAHKTVVSLEEAAPLVAPGKDCNHSAAACTDPQVANTPAGDSDDAMEMPEGEVHSFGVLCPEYTESKGVGHRSSLGSQLLVAAASREDTSAGCMPESPGNLDLALLHD